MSGIVSPTCLSIVVVNTSGIVGDRPPGENATGGRNCFLRQTFHSAERGCLMIDGHDDAVVDGEVLGDHGALLKKEHRIANPVRADNRQCVYSRLPRPLSDPELAV